jgi:hypothetical protein
VIARNCGCSDVVYVSSFVFSFRMVNIGKQFYVLFRRLSLKIDQSVLFYLILHMSYVRFITVTYVIIDAEL